MSVIINGKIVLKNEIVNKNLIIENGIIKDIVDYIPQGEDVIDAKGNYVSPGFIDIHIHGRGGHDVMEGTFEAVNVTSKSLISHGVTGFLPTTMTQSIEKIHNSCKAIKASADKVEGAQVLGIHLEGPFISKVFKGAQPEEYIINPSIEKYNEMTEGCEEYIKMIAIAPEIEGSKEFTKFLNDKGIVASMGHTDATYEQAMDAIKNGISQATHTYNAMKGFRHREPGVVGAVFNSDIYAQCIADGIHSHFGSVSILIRQKGVDKVVLISDCMMAGGLNDGDYEIGGQPVIVKDSIARLHDGTLAGSTLSLDKAVYNITKKLNYGIVDAVKMASTNPAEAVGIKNKGEIKKGYDADIVIFDDEINIKSAYIAGKQMYSK